MTKYTINKVFEKNFKFPIWKIEVDCTENLIAIESRNPENTFPSFFVLDFSGNIISPEIPAKEKEWTLEAIQNDFLILKKFGSSSPIEAGIQIIHVKSGLIKANFHEYVLKDVFQDYLLASHRSIPSGLNFYISIKDGTVTNTVPTNLKLPYTDIHYPIPYQGNIPLFLKEISYEDQIWLQSNGDTYIWSYHSICAKGYNLNLSISSKNQILDTKIILHDLTKLIPQPYFKVKEYIFFLSHTKQEIATYLV